MIEYADYVNGLPRSVRLRRAAPADGAVDLRLTLSQTEVNVDLPAEAFTFRTPAGAEPMTLDELRRSGPLASRRGS
jgi:hypothetical protein